MSDRPGKAIGTPPELAQWAITALANRTHGEVYALVMPEDDIAELMLAHSRKCKEIERTIPHRIAGYYEARRHKPLSLAPVIEADIREVIR